MKKLFCFGFSFLLFSQSLFLPLQADTRPTPEERGASGLALSLRRLQTIASVLHTAAHPDDESTEMLAYLSRKEGARTAYLSLNRGEGGQNGIGPELGENLGVIRTEELLAARKLDGGEQFFTRAFDFGFTRSPEETLQKWNREEVLGDMVRVIRMMRPLVVVSGFSGTARDGHGQHQVAGLLTPEALKAAADPTRFPEQIRREGLHPWQVLKVYGRVFGNVDSGPRAEFDVGVYDPILGRSYNELASDGRSRHRSQDFGMVQSKGTQVRSFPRLSSLITVPEKETTFFTGIDTTITGIAKFAGDNQGKILPALSKIKDLAAKAMMEFRMEQPVAIAPYLADGLREVRALRATLGSLEPSTKATVDGMLARKEKEFNDALVKAHGVVVDALSSTEIVTPGENVEIAAHIFISSAAGINQSKDAPPLVKLNTPADWQTESIRPEPMVVGTGMPIMRGRETPNIVARFRSRVPDNAPATQPYWLAKPRTKEQFDWDDSMPRNLPFAPAIANAQVELTLSGERVIVQQPVEFRFVDKTFGEIRRELKVAPALTLTVHPSLLVIPSGSQNRTREVSVEITNNANHQTVGTIQLIAPAGWKVEGENQLLIFTKQSEKTARTFKVTPSLGAAGNFELKAIAESGGKKFDNGYQVISYPHIEPHFVYHPATTKVEVFDVTVAKGLKVGYVIGSGDDGPSALQQIGVNLKLISPAELASGDLSAYDTIVLGIRVYEVNDAVIVNNKRLLDYVSNGGTLIVQYNKQEFANGNFSPYPVKMAGNLRVTDEIAPITILEPAHPFFNFPNKITDEDWKGWIQERGLYFLSEWDKQFTPLLSAPDDTGTILKGGELVASFGKGHYIFTGYAWFRQFPAGVAGAYRLFANMVSYPKSFASGQAKSSLSKKR
ncbi:MAG: PIG-L family deacetylase [Acidobacteria bacterium]|nr:PIG-L family deacetylase [Acidobacteriota bacterium]